MYTISINKKMVEEVPVFVVYFDDLLFNRRTRRYQKVSGMCRRKRTIVFMDKNLCSFEEYRYDELAKILKDIPF